jgi:GINS complex subunit 1
MHGDLSQKLTQQAKRTLALPSLPPYATDLIHLLTREIRDLDRDVTSLLQPFTTHITNEDGSQSTQSSFNPQDHPATACALLVNHLSMRRDKRCLLAYHRVRAEKLERMLWDGRELDNLAGNNDSAKDNDANRPSLSPEESQYTHAYADLISKNSAQYTDVDLTGSLEPPRDLFIDVRVLKDAGEIQTEYGAINLSKGSQVFVRKGDVERLIQAGFLIRI